MGTSLYVKPGAEAAVADGSFEAPYADLAVALEAANELLGKASKASPVTVTVILEEGVHTVSKLISLAAKKLVITPYGTLNLVARPGTHPVVTGTQSLDSAAFTKVEGTAYYLYQFEADENGNYPAFHDLYVDGVRANVAKSAAYTSKEHFFSDKASEQKGMYIDEELATLLPADDVAGCEYYISADWEFYILHVDAIDQNDTKTIDGKDYVMMKLESTQLQSWINTHNGYLKMHNRGYYLMNHPVFIDEGNEFAYDASTGRLWYRPADGKSITDVALSVSAVEGLIRFRNIKNVTVQGITFTGTTCTQIPESGYLSAQANSDSRYGLLKTAALCFINGENITVRDCTFRDLGTSGVMLRENTETALITNCDFKNIAMSAITVGEHNWTWGANNGTTNLEISNNLVEHTGYDYPSAVAIFVGLVKGGKILRNTIRDVAYTGINVGWGWGHADFKYGESYRVNDVEVAYNHIEKYMQVTRDGGAIYILGSSAEETYREYFNFLHDNYACNEDGDSGQLAFYLDEASANWHVYDNVSIGAPRSLFLQYQAGTFVRNILAERLYADQYIATGNANESRNVIVRDLKLAPADQLFETYPEAKAIAEAAGCTRKAE